LKVPKTTLSFPVLHPQTGKNHKALQDNALPLHHPLDEGLTEISSIIRELLHYHFRAGQAGPDLQNH
jgi:hypothetical protein